MFGKPQWFVPKTRGWGLTPVTWQGWVYTAAWIGVIAVPFVILLTRHGSGELPRLLEAGIWLSASIAALFYDVRSILHQIRGPVKKEQPAVAAAGVPEDVLYIGDDSEPVATRNFQLRRKG